MTPTLLGKGAQPRQYSLADAVRPLRAGRLSSPFDVCTSIDLGEQRIDVVEVLDSRVDQHVRVCAYRFGLESGGAWARTLSVTELVCRPRLYTLIVDASEQLR